MRILFVAPYVPSLIRVRPYNVIRQLAHDHDVTVLALGSAGDDGEALRSICRRVEVVRLGRGGRAAACLAGALRGDPLQASICRSPSVERRLRALLQEDDYDVVHVEHLRAAYVGELVPPRLPVVFDAVDCISLLHARTLRSSHSARHRLVAALELPRTRAYEARCLRRFDRVVVTSADDRAALQALDPSSWVAVIPNGVDLDYFTPGDAPPEPATIVFSGKMSYHANVTAVLHFARNILPLVRAAHPEVRVRIVGSDPPAAIRDLARDPAVEVIGRVPDLRAAIRAATLAVCPVTVKVGIQNKVLEAMALGVPVVSTALGARGLAAVPGRDLLVAEDGPGFAAAVGRLLEDPTLRRDVGAAGRRYVERHHRWEAAAERLTAIYGEVVAGHPHRRPTPSYSIDPPYRRAVSQGE